MKSPQLGVAKELMDSNPSLALQQTESKEEARFETTSQSKESSSSQVFKRLKSPLKKIPWRARLCGRGLNTHILNDRGICQLALAQFKENGIVTLANEYFNKAIQQGHGVAQSWLGMNPILFIADPSLKQQIIFNKSNLVDGEKVGIQRKFFGPDTIISLPASHPKYPAFRHVVMDRLLLAVPALSTKMQRSLDFYLSSLTTASEAKSPVNIEDLSARIAITLLSQTQLGMNNFPEKYKSLFAKIIHDIIATATSPLDIGLISLENLIEDYFGRKLNLARKLNALALQGEKILETVIDFNEETVLPELAAISKEDKLQKKDLLKPQIMSLIKLFLVGGFETTSKSILFSLSMLADAKNSQFVKNLRAELLKKHKSKPVELWTSADLNGLERLLAFALEVLRLFPPFAYMRHASEKPFTMAQNIGIVKNKAEYLAKFNNPERDTSTDIDVPPGTVIATSVFDAHRHPFLYGEDAAVFNPDRWLGKNIDIRSVQTRFDFFTFGNDRRVCPGRLLAQTELLFFISRVVLSFDVTLNLNLPLHLNVGFTLELKKGTKPMAVFSPIAPQNKCLDRLMEETTSLSSGVGLANKP